MCSPLIRKRVNEKEMWLLGVNECVPRGDGTGRDCLYQELLASLRAVAAKVAGERPLHHPPAWCDPSRLCWHHQSLPPSPMLVSTPGRLTVCCLGLGQQAVLIGAETRGSLPSTAVWSAGRISRRAAGRGSQLISTPAPCQCTGGCLLTEHQYRVPAESQVA